MKKIILGLCMAFLLVSLVSAEEITIYINEEAYPGQVVVSAGDTVTWVNNHTDPHTITDSLGYWYDSENIAVGANWSYTFYSLGTNPYYCSYHPGMTGSIEVVLPSETDDSNGTFTPAQFNAYSLAQLQDQLTNTESYVGVESGWEQLTIWFQYTTFKKRWMPSANSYGVQELEFYNSPVHVKTQLNYNVVQHCYNEASGLGENGGDYCTEHLVTSLVPYDYGGIPIDTVSLQLQEDYLRIYSQLVELQKFSEEYELSQSMDIMDIRQAIVSWFT